MADTLSNQDKINIWREQLRKHGEEWFKKIEWQFTELEDILKRNKECYIPKFNPAFDEILENKGITELKLSGYLLKDLPPTIFECTKVQSLSIYGSNVTNVPPEIGNLTKLKDFTPYTSYGLHFLPYEILKCKQLSSLTISTRAIYGNSKNYLPFPNLENFSPNTVVDQELMYHAFMDEPTDDKVFPHPPFYVAIKGAPSLKEQASRVVCDNFPHAKKQLPQELQDFIDSMRYCSWCGAPYHDYYIKCWIQRYIARQKIPLLANVCSWWCLRMIYDDAADPSRRVANTFGGFNLEPI